MPDRVFVADANSTDGTAEMARSFTAEFPIEVLPGGLPSVGRNAGARRAATPYVLFLDAGEFLHHVIATEQQSIGRISVNGAYVSLKGHRHILPDRTQLPQP